MQKTISHYTKVVIQIGLLWLIWQVGELIVKQFNLSVPGNVLGMIILFTLLSTGIIPLNWLAEGASFLLKHLAFFFIPVAVGLMTWGEMIKASGIQLLGVVLGAIAAAIITTGSITQLLAERQDKKS